MNLRTATPELLERLVVQVLERRPDTDAVAVRARPRWDGTGFDIDTTGGHRRSVTVQACPSVLAVRSALVDWDGAPDGSADGSGDADRTSSAAVSGGRRPLLVVLTDRNEHELGTDVLSRFVDGRVLGIDAWNAVRGLFGVRNLDAAFGREDGWVAEALLAHVPAATARSVVGAGTTVLTVDAALTALARTLLGADHLDIYDICRAALTPGAFTQLATVDSATRDGLLARIAHDNGPLGALVAAILASDRRDDLLALGLVARAVYGDGTSDGGKAAGRFEATCDTTAVDPRTAVRLAVRCEEIIDAAGVDPDVANTVVARADALAADWGATATEASEVLPSAFEQRLVAVVTAIDGLPDVADPTDGAPFSALQDALERLDHHHAARTGTGHERVRNARMAARLAVWLTDPAPGEPASFEDAARRYVDEGAWVDRARRRLWRGDDNPAVQDAYRTLLDRVAARRDPQNHSFAELLAAWSATPADTDRLATHALVAVEDVLDTVTAPLVEGGMPVLLVVLDGCGLAAYRELVAEFREFGLIEIIPGTGDDGRLRAPLAGVAALPTITAVSRTSLLSGTITRGDSSTETARFPDAAAHGLPKSATGVLFHHRQLAGPAGVSLAAEVTAAIADDNRAVVGVVINTIDDQLRKGDFAARHRIRDLHVLGSLLDAARLHGRAVVVTADHGHVLAQPLEGGAGNYAGGDGDGGERWRTADREPTAEEIVVRGPRVGVEGNAAILPWVDDHRYGAKAGGYHGGATPGEVLVPVGIHIAAGLEPPRGFIRGSATTPLWWDVRIPAPAATVEPVPPRVGTPPASTGSDSGQTSLFDTPDATAAVDDDAVPTDAPAAADAPSTMEVGRPEWIAALFTTDVWDAQKRAAGRARLDLDEVAAVLEATRRRGDVISHTALANDTALSARRLRGLLTHLVTICNVDGYEVLTNDTDAQELRLQRRLLTEQFGIEVP